MSPVIVWLFLELWDTVYLLVASEYVFVAVPWHWVCYQMIAHAEILDSIVWQVSILISVVVLLMDG